jgi:hypothetical protein
MVVDVVAFPGPDKKTIMLCDEDCAHVYVRAFSWVPPAEFCEKMKKDKGFQDIVTEARHNIASKTDLPYRKEHVDETLTRSVSVKRKYTALNASEFKQACGAFPRVKYVRHLPTLNIPTDANPDQLEKVYCVQHDPDGHFRTVTFKWEMGAVKAKPVMSTDDHIFKSQGDQMMKWSANDITSRMDVEQSRYSYASKPISDIKALVLKGEDGDKKPDHTAASP